ncbi:beta-1-syntrophin-like [Tropilaelaps mercedesae]|uniref:Beta-1-syntrophin-like n=1 Tax=Tropilaelaps mercedesae TaxID=418985 RepID=A0A1V9X9I1_9ACAR|nr:beta-1-syntrophin-like [Tropilaelaps mercedesae]
MGWLCEWEPVAISLMSKGFDRQREADNMWSPVFVAITGSEVLFYDLVPWTREAWAVPVTSEPLYVARVVANSIGRSSSRVPSSESFPRSSPGRHSFSSTGRGRSLERRSSGAWALGVPTLGKSEEFRFSLRIGTQKGIEQRVLRAETAASRAAWLRALVQGAHNCVASIKTVKFECTIGASGMDCILTVHLDEGLSLERVDGVKGERHLWSHPFEDIEKSGDDGDHLLFLKFKGEDIPRELDMIGSPKPVVFTLHTFLSAKLTRLGLIA